MSQSIPLVFVTGNKGKLKEVQEILGDSVPNLTNQSIDLPELQGEPEDIAKEKCRLAAKAIQHPAIVMVEDTSLCYNALHGLPGPYIKWFLEKTGLDGLVNLLAAYKDKSAYSQCVFALALTSPQEKEGDDDQEGKEGKEELMLQQGDGKRKEIQRDAPLVFIGRCPGSIVKARGDSKHFGGGKSWDPIFLPDGYKETFAEMNKDVKNVISHRSLALQQLKKHLDKHPELFKYTAKRQKTN